MAWYCNENRCTEYFGTCVVNILVSVVNVLSIYWDLKIGLDQLQSADFIFWYLWLHGCILDLCTKCMLA
jgi:hypothetical protein